MNTPRVSLGPGKSLALFLAVGVGLMLLLSSLAQAISWQPVASLPAPREALAAATGPDGKIYAIGGYDASMVVTGTVTAYDPATNTWAFRRPLPTARAYLAAATGPGPDGRPYIYAIGGYGATGMLTETLAYDPMADTWTPRRPMPFPREAFAAVTAPDGKIYAIGGYGATGMLTETIAYDPAADTWTPRRPMPTARAYLAAVTGPGPDGRPYIYAIGGYGPTGYLTETIAYDPEANTWTSRAPMPTGRAYLGAATGVDGRIYAIGGYGATGPLSTVEAYNPATNIWVREVSLPAGVMNAGVVRGPDDRLYVIGGYKSTGPTNEVWVTVTPLPGTVPGGTIPGPWPVTIPECPSLPPQAPSDLRAIVFPPHTAPLVELAWTDNSTTEAGFSVGRSTVAAGPYSVVQILDIYTGTTGTRVFVDATATAGRRWYYIVVAFDTCGQLNPSNVAVADLFFASVSGTARDSNTGAPIFGAGVTAARKLDGRVVAGRTTDSVGFYTMTIASGAYTITAIAPGYFPAEAVTLVPPDQTVNLNLPPVGGPVTLSGQVTKEGVTPIGGALVSARTDGLVADATTDFTGSYTLTVGAGQFITLTVGHAALPATGEGFFPVRVRVGLVVTDTARYIRMTGTDPPTGQPMNTRTISGTVTVPPAGLSLANVSVAGALQSDVDANRMPRPEARTMPAGVGLTGTYTLYVSANIWHASSFTAVPGFVPPAPCVGINLTVAPSETCNFSYVTPTVLLTGRVTKERTTPIGGARVSTISATGTLTGTLTDSSGLYTLTVTAGHPYGLKVDNASLPNEGFFPLTVDLGTVTGDRTRPIQMTGADPVTGLTMNPKTILGTVAIGATALPILTLPSISVVAVRQADVEAALPSPDLARAPMAGVGTTSRYTLYVPGEIWFIDEVAPAGFIASPAYYSNIDLRIAPSATGRDFTYAAGYTVSGTVREAATSNPIRDAVVAAIAPGEVTPATHELTGASGGYTLTVTAGTWIVYAKKLGFVDEFRRVTVPLSLTGINFFLRPGVSISGAVTTDGTTGIGGALVRVFSGGVVTGTAATAADGAYTLTVVPSATYSLTVTGARVPAEGLGFFPVALNLGAVTTDTVQNVNLGAYNPQSIAGTVFVPPGLGLFQVLLTGARQADVTADIPLTPDNTIEVAPAGTGPSGPYVLRVPAGTWNVRPSPATGFIPTPPVRANIVLTPTVPASATGQDFSYIPGLSVTGAVKDAVSLAGLVGASVAPVSLVGGPAVISTTTVSGGAYTLTLPSGMWRLTASLTGYLRASQDIMLSTTPLTGIDFLLSPVVFITGTVTSDGTTAISGATVKALRADGTVITTTVTAVTGAYTLPVTTVAADRAYSVTVEGASLPNQGFFPVTVPAKVYGTAVMTDTMRNIQLANPLLTGVDPLSGLAVLNSRAITGTVTITGAAGLTMTQISIITQRQSDVDAGVMPRLGARAPMTGTVNTAVYTLYVPADHWFVAPLAPPGFISSPPVRRSVDTSTANAGDRDFTFARGQRVQGRVRDAATAAAIAGADITARRQYDGAFEASAPSDSTGAYTVTVSQNQVYTVTASAPGYVTAFITQTVVTTDLTGKDFNLSGGITVTGQITKDGINPLVAPRRVYTATVQAIRTTDSALVAAISTDALGYYALTLPMDFSYNLRAVNLYDGNTGYYPTIFATGVYTSVTGVNANVGAANSYSISGRVTFIDPTLPTPPTPTGTDTRVLAYLSGEPALRAIALAATDGTYAVRLPAGTNTWTVSTETDKTGYAPSADQLVSLAPGLSSLGGMDFVYIRGFRVTGRVTKDGTSPLAEATVEVRLTSDNSFVTRLAAEATGYYTLALTVAPRSDSYRIFARGRDRDGAGNLNIAYREAVFAQVITATATGVDFNLGAADPNTITGQVSGVADPSTVTVFADLVGAAIPARVDAIAYGGSFTLRVPNGTFNAGAITSLSGYAQPSPVQVTVPPTATVNFVFSPGAAVSGAVLDSAGMPVAGAVVEALVDSTVVARAPTDASGNYRMGLQTGTYALRASAPGLFTSASRTVTVPPDQTGVNFTLDREYTITGQVSNVPATGATVTATGPRPVSPAATETIVVGPPATIIYTLTVPSGVWRISVSAAARSASPRDVSVPPSQSGINFSLISVLTIQGVVRAGSAGGPGVPNATVTAEPTVPEIPSASATSDSTGAYTLTVLAGTYLVNASGIGFPARTPSFEVFSVIRTDFDLILPTGAVTGRVFAPDGVTPVAQAEVEAVRFSPSFLRATALSDSNGNYTLGGLEGSAAVPSTYTMTARPPAGSAYSASLPTTLVYTGTALSGVDFNLRPPSISGRVTLPDGITGVSGASVRLRDNASSLFRRVDVDSSGNFVFGEVEAALRPYFLTAEPPAGSEFFPSDETQVATLPATGVVLRLRAADISGSVTDPDNAAVESARIDVTNPDFSVVRSVFTDGRGRYRVGGLTTDIYIVTVAPPFGAANLLAPAPRGGVRVISGQPVTVDFRFSRPPRNITGLVRKGTAIGPAATDARVNATRQDTGGLQFADTDSGGAYTLTVETANWLLMVLPRPGAAPNWMYTQPPVLVSTTVDAVVNFIVDLAPSTVQGRVRIRDARGNLISPVDGSVIVAIRTEAGSGADGVVRSGAFSVTVPAGTYRVLTTPLDPNLTAPVLPPVTVAAGQTVTIDGDANASGDSDSDGNLTNDPIVLTIRQTFLRGRVTSGTDAQGNPNGVADIPVQAWQRPEDGGSLVNTTSGAAGFYELPVTPGRWWANASPDPVASGLINANPPAALDLTAGETRTVNFSLSPASAIIRGNVVRTAVGRVLGEVAGSASARSDTPGMPTFSAPIAAGTFELRVRPGDWSVGLALPPGSGYTAPAERPVRNLSAGETRTITMPVTPNEVILWGQVVDDSSRNLSAADWGGYTPTVFAGNSERGWAETQPTAGGSYTMSVAPGRWRLDVRVDPRSTYIPKPGEEYERTLGAAGVTVRVDMILVWAAYTITGAVYAPDGTTPVGGAWVSAVRLLPAPARFIGGMNADASGRYTLTVSPGTYQIQATVGAERGFLAPQPLSVVVTADVGGQNLTFLSGTATIRGRVLRGGNPEAALVRAWSEKGASAEFRAGADGYYTLTVTAPLTVIATEVWRVEALAEVELTAGRKTLFKSTDPARPRCILSFETGCERTVNVAYGTTLVPGIDLSLSVVGDLPDANSPEIRADEMRIITLADGTEIIIPAGALPISSACEARTPPDRRVRITITPRSDLPRHQTLRIVGFGYDVVARDCQGPITRKFNAKVTIRFRSTVAVGEGFVPALYSHGAGAWQPLGSTADENWTIHRVGNIAIVEISTNHFTEFAILATGGAASVEAPPPVVGAPPTPTPYPTPVPVEVPPAVAPPVVVPVVPTPTPTPVPLATPPPEVPVVTPTPAPVPPPGVPPAEPALGGQLVLIPPAPEAVAVITTDPTAPVYMTVLVPGSTETLAVRVQPLTLDRLPLPLPVGVGAAKVLSLDVYRAETGQRITFHPRPIEIVIAVTDQDLARAAGDPNRLAIARYNATTGQYFRLPTTYDPATRTLRASVSQTSVFVVAVLTPELAAVPITAPVPLAPVVPMPGLWSYLPFLAKGAEGFTAGFQVQNLGGADARVEVAYYSLMGGLVNLQTESIPAGRSKTFYGPSLAVPEGFFGSAVVSADQPIAVIANALTAGPSMSASYDGASVPSTSQYLPLIMRQNRGWNTEIFVQNAGSVAATGVKLEFYQGQQLVAEVAAPPVAPGASYRLRQIDQPELGEGWVGSVRVVADQPVAAVVLESDGAILMGYSGFGAGVPRVYAPLIMTDNYGWYTGLQVQNVGGREEVVVLRVNGEAVDSAAIAPGASKTWYPVPGTGSGFVGSAVVEGGVGAELVGIVNEFNPAGGQGMAYRAFGGGTASVFAPLIMTDNYGWYTGLQVQNVGASDAEVVLRLNGAAVETVVIAAGRSKTWYPVPGTFPGFVGAATVEGPADAQLVGIVNEITVPQQAGETSMVYEAFNR